MDNSFDERCETDISDCFEDILEGEEEVFLFFYLGNLIMKVIHYAVCSPTNAFFFLQNQQPATLGFTAGKNNRFPAINKNPGYAHTLYM